MRRAARGEATDGSDDRARPRRWPFFAAGMVAGAVAGAVTLVLVEPAGTTDLLAASELGPATPRLVEATSSAGLQHRYDGGFQFYVGGGVAAFDCDDDGLEDLYLAGGRRPAALYRNTSTVAGSLRFDLVVDDTTDLGGVTGAYPVDVDGDAVLDLVVLRVGENVVLRGLGGCAFERANESWGLDGGSAWTAAFSATWEREDGPPTLAFANYLETSERPDGSRRCEPSELLRPEDPTRGTGSPIRYADPQALTPGRCALSALFSDWDGSGRHDLRLTNDRHYYRTGGEQLWQVLADRPPRRYTEADGWQPLQLWGMGIAEADLTDDGRPEVVLASQGDNKLQTLDGPPGEPTYVDIALDRGTTAHRPFMGDPTLRSTAWHPALADVNNDGLVDLFLSKGNVEAQVDHAAQDPSNLLLQQADGRFVERAREAGLVSLGLGRGAAVVDLNLDGHLDIVEVQRGEPVRVWRNTGAGQVGVGSPGHWAQVRLHQDGANSWAVGSWVEVRTATTTWRRQLTVGGGHASGHLGWMHVGLGGTDSAEVRVRWPDGTSSGWLALPLDGFLDIARSSAAGAATTSIFVPGAPGKS